MEQEKQSKYVKITMIKILNLYSLFLLLILCTSCDGKKTIEMPKVEYEQGKEFKQETKKATNYKGPKTITRNIKQDKNGNIWLAAFDGVFRYDGKSFYNVIEKVSDARFFSVMEDKDGNLWFGSIGSGLYQYDGVFFHNYTSNEGLLSDEIVSIFQDKDGDIWFGCNGGVSVYDGTSFKSYLITGDTIIENKTGIVVPSGQRPITEVNSFIQDRSGKIWLGTRGSTFIYDGHSFDTFTNKDVAFQNVRRIIEDRKGNVWLGGNDGLWRYDGNAFTNITKDFVGYIYEDRAGNIWTSSDEHSRRGWALSRYDQESLSQLVPKPTIVKFGEGMIFGILEADDGTIWFGTFEGVQRYDGSRFDNFRGG